MGLLFNSFKSHRQIFKILFAIVNRFIWFCKYDFIYLCQSYSAKTIQKHNNYCCQIYYKIIFLYLDHILQFGCGQTASCGLATFLAFDTALIICQSTTKLQKNEKKYMGIIVFI